MIGFLENTTDKILDWIINKLPVKHRDYYVTTLAVLTAIVTLGGTTLLLFAFACICQYFGIYL